MTIKVARIPDLNCEPFYYDMERRGIELHDMAAGEVVAAAEAGEVDAGPVPLVECFRLGEHFRPVTGFCIAAVNTAGSSILYSKQPIESLTGTLIGVPEDTNTSFRLLQVLLSLRYQVQPEAFVGLEDSYDAFLLTGNRALRQRRGARGYPHRYDLGEEWHDWTTLPFVFDRWMVRKGLDSKDAAVLEDALFVGQEDWLDNLYRMSGPRNDILMRPQDVLEYVQGLRFYIGVPEEKAMDLFRQYLDELALGPPRSPETP